MSTSKASSGAALILAAGEGTRMRSDLPKVAHAILGVPLVGWVIRAAEAAGCDPVVLVTGHGAELVEEFAEGRPCVRQDEQLGTGHAVMCAEGSFEGFEGSLLVVAGDCPLVRPETLRRLVETREAEGAAAAVLTAELDDPSGYGRILRDRAGSLSAIVEQKDLASHQEAIREVNTSLYCFDARALFAHLHKLEDDNAQGEYYLTDMVALFRSEGLEVATVRAEDAEETLGVNSRVQLAEAAVIMQGRLNRAHMLAGVTMIDPSLVWVGPDVSLGRDVVLEPMTFLMGETSVGDRARIGPATRVTDSSVGEDAVVDSSVVVRAVVGDRATVGPNAYLRPGTVLEARAKAGTSVEIKNSRIGEGSKVPHLSYIGDADIGRDVNVGAGSITCNYDGEHKHGTRIGDGAFIGSDTMLIAPVEIGEGATTGAGSAIARDVPPGALGVERCEQRTVEGWTARKRRGKDEG